MKKKLVAGLASSALVVSALTPAAFAANFQDVQGTQYQAAVNLLKALNVVNGDTTGNYNPYNTITRAEFAKIAIEAAGLDASAQAAGNGAVTGFNDVDGTGYGWAAGYIKVARDHGIVKGVDQWNFAPGDNVKYEDVITVLERLLGYTDSSVGGYYNGYVAKAQSLGLLKGTGFTIGSAANRGDVAILTANTLSQNVVGGSKSLLASNFSSIPGTTSVSGAVYAASANTITVGGSVYNVTDDSDIAGGTSLASLVGHNVNVSVDANGNVVYLTDAGAIANSVAKISISGNNTVGIGQSEKLVAVAQDSNGNNVNLPSNVTAAWSVGGTGAVIDSNGNFVATAAGNYTVTATINGVSATANVAVYGQAAGVKLSAANTNIVANNVYQDVLTATVVDANGNAVANFNGAVTVNYVDNNGNNVAGQGSSLINPTTGANGNNTISATVTNGVATIKVQSGNTVGVTDKLKVTSVTALGNNTSVQYNGQNISSSVLAITTQAQVATSVKVNAPKAMANNSNASLVNVSAVVLDQSGAVMLSGSYPISYTISGPASIVGGTSNNTWNTVFTGNNTQNNTSAQIQLQPTVGQTGNVNVSATYGSLPAGTAAISVVAAGTPTALQLTQGNTSFVQGVPATATNVATINVQVVDANGTPVSDQQLGSVGNGSVQVNVSGPQKQKVTIGTLANGVVTTVGQADSNGNITVNFPDTTGKVTLAIWDVNGGNADAGTYTIKVSSTANNYNLAAQSVTVTDQANVIKQVGVSSPSFPSSNILNVTPANTAITYTLQLKDQYGNAINQAGVTVNVQAVDKNGVAFGGAGFANTGNATVNGVNTQTTPLQLTTDANGKITATLTPQGYINDQWQLAVSVPTQTLVPAGIATANTGKFVQVVNVSPSTIAAQFNDKYDLVKPQVSNVSVASAGDNVDLVLTAKDQYGNVLAAGDTVKVVLPPQLSGTSSLPAGAAKMDSGSWTQWGTNSIDVTLSAGGTQTVNLVAGSAGSGSVSITDLSNSGAATGSASLGVNALTASTVAVFQNGSYVSSGKLSISANTPVAFQVTPVDAENNAGVQATTTTYTLSDGGNGGQFSLTPGGAAVTSVTVPVNSTGVTVYYTNSSNSLSSVNVSVNTAGTTMTATTSTTPTVNSASNLYVYTQGQQINGVQSVTISGLVASPTGVAASAKDNTNTAVNAVAGSITLNANFVNGQAVIPVTFASTTAQTVGVSTTINGNNLSWTAGNVTPKAAAVASVTAGTAALTSGAVGTPQAVTFVAKDANGNVVANASVSVAVTVAPVGNAGVGTVSSTIAGTYASSATVTTDSTGTATVYFNPGSSYVAGGAVTDTITATSNSQSATTTYAHN